MADSSPVQNRLVETNQIGERIILKPCDNAGCLDLILYGIFRLTDGVVLFLCISICVCMGAGVVYVFVTL